MPKEFSRTARLEGQIQRDLAELIRTQVKDPRLGMVSISDVQLSRDLAHAKVFVSSLDDPDKTAESVEVLNRAAGFLRHQLGRMLHIRAIPHLRFQYDESAQRGAELSALIDQAVASDAKPGRGPAGNNDNDGD